MMFPFPLFFCYFFFKKKQVIFRLKRNVRH